MKKLSVTLLMAVMLTSCAVTGMAQGFDDLTVNTTEMPLQDQIIEEEPVETYGLIPGAEPPESLLLKDSVIEPPDGMTSEEVYYTLCEAFLHGTPTFSYPPFEEYYVWLQEVLLAELEEAQNESEQVVEEITPPVAMDAPEPILEAPQRSTMDKLMDGDAPDSILIGFCVLFIATLFTLCYISKQRKEATWHRFRD